MPYPFRLALLGLILSLSACSSNPPAPVIERAPAKPAAPPPVTAPEEKPSTKTTDWRPDSYTVKKGDTLISIGLEYGYDYKEIAEANGLSAPYTIRIGQILKLGSLNDKTTPPSTEGDGVVITPINQEAPVTLSTPPKYTLPPGTATTPGTTVTPVKPSILVIAEPKAISEPYSEEAYKKIVPGVNPPATAPSSPVKPVADANAKDVGVDTKTDSKANPPKAGDIDWLWPTKGKVVGNFRESSNKGLDIAGVTGQSIQAAASGKVIYSGSDLRGYGKLVIIKHNQNYLSVYAHNSQILVKEGQQVSRGQKIAEMGNTDSSTVKLHFEIRHQGKSVDPAKYLAAN